MLNNSGKRYWGDGMLDVIKQAAVAAVEAAGPVKLLEATVLTPPPGLSIQLGLDTKNPIPAEMLIVDEGLTKGVRKIRVASTEDGLESATDQYIRYEDELQAGDKVLVISVQGGQSFYIAAKGVRYGSNA